MTKRKSSETTPSSKFIKIGKISSAALAIGTALVALVNIAINVSKVNDKLDTEMFWNIRHDDSLKELIDKYKGIAEDSLRATSKAPTRDTGMGGK